MKNNTIWNPKQQNTSSSGLTSTLPTLAALSIRRVKRNILA